MAGALTVAAASADGIEDMRGLPSAEVVILGEVHDNAGHHDAQSTAVAAMGPAALVFEMLDEAQARAATGAMRGDADALAEALGWAESGWPDFAMYWPIFAAAPDAAIYGGGVPGDDVRRAAGGEGAAGVFGPDAALYGLDRPLAEDDLAQRSAEQSTAHCDALPEDLLPGMVEAQRLRDAALARATLRAVNETGGPVAVITGNGHARVDRGIPVYLKAARPGLDVLSVGQLEAPPEDTPPFDLWRVTEPAERPDPCEAFR